MVGEEFERVIGSVDKALGCDRIVTRDPGGDFT